MIPCSDHLSGGASARSASRLSLISCSLALCVGVPYTSRMANGEHPDFAADDDFPEINDDTIGTVFTDQYGMTYVCIYVESYGAYAWWPLGRAK